MPNEFPRFSELRKGRVSIPHSRYFITLCTRGKAPGLLSGDITANVRVEWDSLHARGDALTRCATVMPNHLHWVFELGTRLTLSQVLARFKASTRGSLLAAGLRWQDNFFEHRIRPEEDTEAYAYYVFKNPVRAGLCEHAKNWPHWYCPDHARHTFATTPANWDEPPFIPQGMAP